MTEIGQQFIDQLKKIAANNPDFIYERPPSGSCRYVFGGEPSCVVGKVAWDLGYIGPGLEVLDVNSDGVDGLITHLGLSLTLEEKTWLGAAQNAQDDSEPWGELPTIADEYMREQF